MTWQLKAFDELTTAQLHDIYRLRVDVFVVEQHCPYPEIDGADPACLHLFKEEGNQIAAYARLLPPGTTYPSASIGRIIVAPEFRKQSLGFQLLDQAIAAAQKHWPGPLEIGAQAHLKDFYASRGFNQVGEIYLEDGIPHMDMKRP